MALEISGNIQFDNGLTLSSIYGRTRYKVDDSSSNVLIMVDFWLNEDSYVNGLTNVTPSLNVNNRYNYNRNVDGVDVLLFTQNKIKTELESLGYSVEITGL